jgi:hypothetical protein
MELSKYNVLACLKGVKHPQFYNVKIVAESTGFSPLIRKKAMMMCEYFENHTEPVYHNDIYLNWVSDKNNPDKLTAAKCFLEPEDLIDYFQPFEGRGSEKNRELAVQYLKNTDKKFVLRYCSLKDFPYRKAYSLTISLNKEIFEHYAIIHDIGDGYYFGIKAMSGNSVGTAYAPIKAYSTIVELLIDQVKI